MLEKIFKLSDSSLEVKENMNVYKMIPNEENDSFDVQRVDWKNKKHHTFFLDDDDDPFNGEMVMFQKTKMNKLEMRKIKCNIPSSRKGLPESDSMQLVVRTNDTSFNEFEKHNADCIVEPFSTKNEL